MALTNLPECVRVGSRVYRITEKVGRIKSDKGRVWLHPEKDAPFQIDWPMRLHSSTRYMECKK